MVVHGGWSAGLGRLASGCRRIATTAVVFAVVGGVAAATPYSYTTSGDVYTQNFDTLPSSGGSSTFPLTGLGPFNLDTAPVAALGTDGWQFWKYAGNTSNALFSADNGSAFSGSTYSYGTTASTERALGVLASGSGSYRIGMVLQNNTGTTLTSFTLGYLGEQWRYGGSTNENRLTFDYSIGAGTQINASQTFTTVAGLDFVRPVASGTAGALDGNLPANQRSISGTVSGLAWAPGDYLVIRWSDRDETGSDDGLAIDNLTFTASGAAAGSNLYWGGAAGWGATSPGAGGSGTWADGSGSWDPTKTANFAGPAGSVTISGTATAQAGVTFAVDGYTVAGGTLALGGTENLVIVNPGLTATINSALSGTSGFTKAGLGTLVLGGTNSFTGGLTIGAGTVSVAAATALGDAAGPLVFSGGGLRTTASLDLGSRAISGAASFDIAAGTTLSASGAATLSGLTLTNTGTLALAGFANAVGTISATAGSGTAIVTGNLDLGTAGRTVTVASGGTLELAGNLTGSGIMDKTGGGRLLLSGDNTTLARVRIGTQGATPVAGGTVAVSTATALGADQVYFNNGTIEATTPLTFANGLSIAGRSNGASRFAGAAMTFQGLTGTFNPSGAVGDVSLVVDNDTTIAGDFTATGTPLAVSGSGTLRLTGFTTGLTAPVSVGGGATLSVQGTSALGSTLLTVASGGTLAGDGTVGAVTVNSGGTLAPGLGLGTLRAGGTTFAPGGDYNLQITDAAGTAGSGWDLLDATGALTISATAADPFAVNLWSLSGTNPAVNGNAANFNDQTGYAWTFARGTSISGFAADKFTVNTAAVNGTGGFTNDLAGGAFSVAAVGNDLNVVFTPFVPGTTLDWYGNGIAAGGAGNWTSLGANWSPDSGTTVGTWSPARTAVFGGTGGTVTVQSGGIAAARGLDFRADGYTLAGGSVTLSGATAADNAITVGSGATTTVSAPLVGSAGMTKAGPGALVLSGTNTYSGGTTVAGGTLQVGNGTSGSIGGDVAVATGGRLAFNPGSSGSFGGAISGNGIVAKQGSGGLVLSGANSHSGGTRLEGGSLTAGGSSAFGSGSVTAVEGGLYAAAGASITNAITVGDTPGAGQTPVLIAGWDFQTTSNGGTALAAQDATQPTAFVANFGSGTLFLDGTNGSSAWSTTQLNAFSGTAVNAGPGFSTSTTSPAALALVGSGANGQQAVFAVDMTSYALLDVSYATRYSGAEAFTSQQWAVSTDGTTWLDIGTQSVGSTTFSTKQLSTISALAGASTAYLRLTVNGATSATSNNRLDNLQLLATPGSPPSGTVVLGTQATSGTATFSGDLRLNRGVTLSAAAGGRAEFTGVISDAFGQNGVTKVGAGTVVLGGVNTYAGLTTVNAGTLLVTATSGAAGVTVAGGALGGTGAVGPLLVNAGGQVAPGTAGPGTLTVGATTLGGGASYAFQIADASGAAGTGWDLLDVNGGLSVTATQGSPFTVDLWTVTSGDTSGQASGFSPFQPYRWTFLDTNSSLAGLDLTAFAVNASATGTTGGFANATQGGTFSVAVSDLGTGLDVVYTPDAAASSLVWYGDDASPGGKGDWTSLNVNWFNGATVQVWDAAKTALFGTAGGEVTIGPAGIAAGNGLSFQAAGYVMNGGGLSLTGGSRLANSITVADGVSTTISAAIGGSSGMTKAGAGTLVLTAESTVAGGISVAAGTLQLGAGGTAGSLAGDFLLGPTGTLAIDRSDALTIAGQLTGAGGVRKQGAGVLTLTGNSSYSGGTAVAVGTVVVGDGGTTGSIAAAGGIDVAAGTVLAFDRSDTVAFTGGVTGSGTLEQRGSGALTLSRGTPYGPDFTLAVADGTVDLNRAGGSLVDIVGAGNTVMLAGGTLQLTSGFGEGTKFAAAAIDVQASSTLAVNRVSSTPNNHSTTDFATPIIVGNDATLSFDFLGQITTGFKGTTTYTAAVTLDSDAGFAVTNSAGGTAEVIFAGAVGDGGAGHGLAKAGPQRLTLAGVNTYTGGTAVAAGTLALGATGTIDASPLLSVASGATFDVSAKTGGYVVPTGQTIAGDGGVTGPIAFATGSTVSPGAPVGTLTTSGDVTFGGGGNYNWQIVDAAGVAGAATGWDLLSAGGALSITATSSTPFSINLWSLSATAPVTSGSAANFDPTQAGTWKIASAAGGITGFAANAFTVNVAAANGTAGFANAVGNGTFSVAQSGSDLNLVYTPGVPTNDIVINVPSGSQTQAQAGHPLITSADSVTKIGAGTVVFDAANTYTGPTTVSAGTLRVAAAAALATTGVTVETGATLAVAPGTTMRAPSVTVDGGTLDAGTLAVNSATGIETLLVNSGTVASAAALVVGPGGLVGLPVEARVRIGVASLAVSETASGGLLDLGAGQVTVAPGGISGADLRADIIAGLNGGGWNGTAGITSAAAASSGGTRAVGYVVDGSGARVSFAAPGDCNLDGFVDLIDLLEILGSGTYETGVPSVWIQGDFNYDGSTDLLDLLAILGSGTYDQGNYFPVVATGLGGGPGGSVAAVPEPAAFPTVAGALLAGLAGLGFARRRLVG